MEHPLTARLAALIASDLDHRQISHRELSARTGIPTTTLHRRLHGHAPFTFSEIDVIADVLGTTVLDLVARAEQVAA